MTFPEIAGIREDWSLFVIKLQTSAEYTEPKDDRIT